MFQPQLFRNDVPTDLHRADQEVSEHELWIAVDLLESARSTLVKDGFGLKALVLVEVVGGHAGSESVDVLLAELGEDGLSGGTFILSWEAKITGIV